jgi:hypothetical protein
MGFNTGGRMNTQTQNQNFNLGKLLYDETETKKFKTCKKIKRSSTVFKLFLFIGIIVFANVIFYLSDKPFNQKIIIFAVQPIFLFFIYLSILDYYRIAGLKVYETGIQAPTKKFRFIPFSQIDYVIWNAKLAKGENTINYIILKLKEDVSIIGYNPSTHITDLREILEKKIPIVGLEIEFFSLYYLKDLLLGTEWRSKRGIDKWSNAFIRPFKAGLILVFLMLGFTLLSVFVIFPYVPLNYCMCLSLSPIWAGVLYFMFQIMKEFNHEEFILHLNLDEVGRGRKYILYIIEGLRRHRLVKSRRRLFGSKKGKSTRQKQRSEEEKECSEIKYILKDDNSGEIIDFAYTESNDGRRLTINIGPISQDNIRLVRRIKERVADCDELILHKIREQIFENHPDHYTPTPKTI